MIKVSGYTLIELITVIILLGILSAVAVPRFFNLDPYNNFFSQAELESGIAWARNRAVTEHCSYEVRFDDTGWQILRDANCSTELDEAGCSSGEVWNFNTTTADASGNSMQADSPTSDAVQRLFILPTGRLYQAGTLPTALGCTAIPAASVTNGTVISLSNTNLSIDGETAYVELQ